MAFALLGPSHLEHGFELTGDPCQLIQIMLEIDAKIFIELVKGTLRLILRIETLLILYTWIEGPVSIQRVQLTLPQIIYKLIDLFEQLLSKP